MLYRFTLKCIRRDDGSTHIKEITAGTEHEAFKIVADQGYVVEKVRKREPFDEPRETPVNHDFVSNIVPQRPAPEKADVLQVLGIFAIIAGIVLTVVGVFQDISVGGTTLDGLERVANLGLMNTRLVTVACGTALFISGAVSYVGGAMIRELRERVKPSSDEPH